MDKVELKTQPFCSWFPVCDSFRPLALASCSDPEKPVKALPGSVRFACCLIPLWTGHLTAAFAASANPYSIVDFGAVSDGKTINTTAIQAAIDKCHQDGGGKVLIPAGNFLAGGVHLLSNMQLYLIRRERNRRDDGVRITLPLVVDDGTAMRAEVESGPATFLAQADVG